MHISTIFFQACILKRIPVGLEITQTGNTASVEYGINVVPLVETQTMDLTLLCIGTFPECGSCGFVYFPLIPKQFVFIRERKTCKRFSQC